MKIRGVSISNHALLRYQERVADVPMEEAAAAIAQAVHHAVHFGASVVRLGGGQRIVIRDRNRVVTVLGKDSSVSAASRVGKARRKVEQG